MKKNSSILMVLLLALASFTPDSEYRRGDVDLNGEVNITDLTELIDYLLNGFWSDEEPAPTTGQTFTVNGVSFTMIEVEGGTFMMGATDDDSKARNNEKPAHQVTLSDYCIGETEVTQALWYAVMGWNRSVHSGDPMRPVEVVMWSDCQTFITKLNQLTGKTFRLPTEAEWEFAARGGNYSNGYMYPGSDNLYDVAWCYYNASLTTHTVGLKRPNELGLYDMAGNVAEWCQDYYGSYSDEAQTDPTGPESSYARVMRGGGYYWLNSQSSDWRVTCRNYSSENAGYEYVGLRLAM